MSFRDGDDSNLHAPQHEDARAEVAELMNVKECIMSGQTNSPMIGIVYDALTGAYLMTQADTDVEEDDYQDCLGLMTSRNQLVTLDDRLAKHGVRPRSGRALFSALLPEDFFYTKGNVYIKDGVLLQGEIKKDHIGVTSNSIVQYLWHDYGRDRTVEFLTDLPWIMNRWLASRGFSVGLKDCFPRDDRHRKVIAEEIESAKIKVAALGSKLDDPLEEEHREKQIVAYVNSLRILEHGFLQKTWIH